MATLRTASKKTPFFCIAAATSVALWLPVNFAAAQGNQRTLGIDEITVTAQRREQSLQDVPISIEVFSGDLIRQQGFRDLDDLANFSPTVLIEPRVQDQDISIRGFGTTGNALTLDQAVPTFVDGIHFGRSSQVKLAFLDTRSVEVLKGPQPVYFGQNATAGAFNIRSVRPGASWEGYGDLEVANNTRTRFNAAIGGPINERWGIRVAGTGDTTNGYLENVLAQGTNVGGYENYGGRVMLQFTPSDRLTITGKAEASRIRKDSEVVSVCRTDGPLIFGRGGPLDDPGDPPGDERSVWDRPPEGTAWGQSYIPLDTDCFSSNRGHSEGGPYYQPPDTIREENSNRGSLDIRAAADAFAKTAGNNGVVGYEDLDANNGYVEFAYEVNDQIELEWLSGWAIFERDYVQENSDSPFLMNFQGRGEDFTQYSTELRLSSSNPGFFEWNAGFFYQNTDLEAFSSSLRANVRQSQRYNFITEEVDFKAIFGSVTFNMLDERLSLDIGGRYADIEKFATVRGYAASWIFTELPQSAIDRGDQVDIIDPATARLYLPVDPGATLYAMPYRESRNVPLEWLPSNAVPVGLTAPDFAVRENRGEGPYAEKFKESPFDPQVALRFRATENMTVYGRYAEATKIGGFDTGQTSIPRDIEELTYESENGKQYELGLKGTAWDSRVRYDVNLFYLDVPNLQTTAVSPDPNQTSASVNAGQRVQGVEFNTTFAVTEDLIMAFSGALMDGEMTDFKGSGCTDQEIFVGVGNPDAACKFFDDNGDQFVPADILDAVDADVSLIDRTGAKAPRTPDWKFVLTADYARPFGNNLEFRANAKAFYSDGYILDVESFSQIIKYNEHGDLNLMFGVHNLADNWAVSVFGRNLFEARPSYNAEFDVIPLGVRSQHISPASVRSVGLKVQYFVN